MPFSSSSSSSKNDQSSSSASRLTKRLRVRLSMIMQAIMLMTIRENITLFADFPEEAVERAIRLSGLSGLILERGEDCLP